MLRRTRFALIAVAAVVIVASVATVAAVSQSRGSDTPSECKGDPMNDPHDCPSHERMRRYCREHPREPRCQRMAAAHPEHA